MENTTFDISVSGDYVRSLQHNNANLFRIAGEAGRATTRQRHSLLRSVTPIMVMTPIQRSRSRLMMRAFQHPRHNQPRPLRFNVRPNLPRSSMPRSEQSSWFWELQCGVGIRVRFFTAFPEERLPSSGVDGNCWKGQCEVNGGFGPSLCRDGTSGYRGVDLSEGMLAKACGKATPT